MTKKVDQEKQREHEQKLHERQPAWMRALQRSRHHRKHYHALIQLHSLEQQHRRLLATRALLLEQLGTSDQRIYTPSRSTLSSAERITLLQLRTALRGVFGSCQAMLAVGEGDSIAPPLATPIQLNVGGRLFTTSRETLLRSDSPLLRSVVRSAPALPSSSSPFEFSQGAPVFFDRSSLLFDCILDFLRDDHLITWNYCDLHRILAEARFYGLARLQALVRERLRVLDRNLKK